MDTLQSKMSNKLFVLSLVIGFFPYHCIAGAPVRIRTPIPSISPDAWLEAKQLLLSEKSVALNLKIQIKEGIVEQASVETPGRVPMIEKETIAWVKQRWQFKPDGLTAVIVPIEFLIPDVIALNENRFPSGTSAPPIPFPHELSSNQARSGAGALTVRFTVDQGKVTTIQSAPPGNPVLARAAESWIREHWAFRPDLRGEFTCPVQFTNR
jgi:hypothetical protein